MNVITNKARELVFWALELGWKGPPFDPFSLAELLDIDTTATSEILDARTVPVGGSRFRIEYNPDRPRRRIRYSLFHELAHTLFPDCAQMIRHRGMHTANSPDEWQLETLCNIAAAELLLPAGVLGGVDRLEPSVDAILDIRGRYEASAEAALLRICRLTTEPALAFSCHRDPASTRYVIDYAAATANCNWSLRAGSTLPTRTAAAECVAIGYTAKNTEVWPTFDEVSVECIGVAPFPGDVYPRVIGFVRPLRSDRPEAVAITYLRGDATQMRGTDRKLLLQIVNDAAVTWGGSGFSVSVRRRWPEAQKAFTTQVESNKLTLRLGNVVPCQLGAEVTLLNAIAQHGYGRSARPRIRYGALRECLLQVSEMARDSGATVHMPRIGAGQAGGSWAVVEEIIRETLTRVGVKVFVYDLPQGKERTKAQQDLPLFK